MNRSINERAHCIILNAGLENNFWVEVVSMACYLINRSPRASLDRKDIEEVQIGNELDYLVLRVLGCPGYSHIDGDVRSKLDVKSS